ncbi:MAG: GtrA family protein [Pseudomonadota bacterium]|nr:GtrA family protein [Pseudomonadota bacterium]
MAAVQPRFSPRCRAQAGRIDWFIAVGCTAALVHWAVVVGLVSGAGWRPLAANVAGWLVAFGVSYSGHRRWTFRDQDAPLQRSLLRFFLVSATGFLVNEGVYALLLDWSVLRYDAVLAIVLVVVAGFTYWLGRHWAFLRSEAP